MKEKRLWFWIVTFLILVFLINIILLKIKNTSVGSAGISLEEFEKIELGMSQSTVQSLVDSEDRWDDDEIYEKYCQEISKSKDGSTYQYTYKYIGEKDGYAEITYEADYSNGDLFVLPVVTNKKQVNLK